MYVAGGDAAFNGDQFFAATFNSLPEMNATAANTLPHVALILKACFVIILLGQSYERSSYCSPNG